MNPASSTAAMSKLSQSGYRFIDFDEALRGGRRGRAQGGNSRAEQTCSSRYALYGALGQDDLNRGLLHRHLDVRCNLEIDVVVADLRDAPERAAGGHDLVALGERSDHLLLLL